MTLRQKISYIKKKAFGQAPPLKIQTKCNRVWYGNGYGGFYINPDLLNSSSIVYSIGIGEDISFDLDVINKNNSTVFGFDPTPRCIEWVKSQKLPENFNFTPVGISEKDGTITFYEPENETHVSFSAVIPGYEKRNGYAAEVRTLKSLMESKGHTKIDVLKMDIEGSEYGVIENFLAEGCPATQIVIEFHDRFIPNGIVRTMDAVKQLNSMGFKIFGISDPGNEVSFIKM